MVYEIKSTKPPKGEDKFDFTLDGKAFSVPKLKFVPVARRLEISGDTAAMLAFFCGDTDEQAKAVGNLLDEDYIGLVDAWQKDSEVTLGESQASAS